MSNEGASRRPGARPPAFPPRGEASPARSQPARERPAPRLRHNIVVDFYWSERERRRGPGPRPATPLAEANFELSRPGPLPEARGERGMGEGAGRYAQAQEKHAPRQGEPDPSRDDLVNEAAGSLDQGVPPAGNDQVGDRDLETTKRAETADRVSTQVRLRLPLSALNFPFFLTWPFLGAVPSLTLDETTSLAAVPDLM